MVIAFIARQGTGWRHLWDGAARLARSFTKRCAQPCKRFWNSPQPLEWQSSGGYTIFGALGKILTWGLFEWFLLAFTMSELAILGALTERRYWCDWIENLPNGKVGSVAVWTRSERYTFKQITFYHVSSSLNITNYMFNTQKAKPVKTLQSRNERDNKKRCTSGKLFRKHIQMLFQNIWDR